MKHQNHQNQHQQENTQQSKQSSYFMAQLPPGGQLRSTVALISTIILFVIGCSILFSVINAIMPIVQIIFAFGLAYLFVINHHFEGFRRAFFNHDVGVRQLWKEFCYGWKSFLEAAFGENWWQKICKNCKS